MRSANGEVVNIPVRIGAMASYYDPDDIIAFTDADGTAMTVSCTLLGLAKTPARI